MSNTAIKVENLGKMYRLGEVGTGTISHDLNRWWARVRGKEDPFAKIGEANDRTVKGQSDYVWSLKDINFEVKQGEVLGIIGRNGAGKSTLLKILSKVTTPTTGKIKVNGRIASLLEVGTGFHPELTGRENIFLNGAILGMTKTEIRSKFDEIVDFAGVERYIDTPVKRYSSGMYVRLAFAVAAFLEPEILIVDEVLAVGDAEFQKKCIGRMKDVSVNNGRTVLFVSHDLNAVSQLCDRGILLKQGSIEMTGNVSSIVSAYLTSNKKTPVFNAKEIKSKQVNISKIYISDATKSVSSDFTVQEEVHINIELAINHLDYPYSLFIVILDSKKRRVFSGESLTIKEKMTLVLKPNSLVRGEYSLLVIVNIPKLGPVDMIEDVCNFTIIDNSSFLVKHGDYDYGVVFGQFEWQ